MAEHSVFEILTWRSATGVEDSSMIKAMQHFSKDVAQLSGFIQQALYKNKQSEWVCVYYWETVQQAHDSNVAVADKESFQSLMQLIEENSVTMEVMTAMQSS